MNLSFSTRGWKDLPWDRQVSDAEEYRFQGIEVYDLYHCACLTDRSGAFHKYHQNETLRDLRGRGLSLCCLDTPLDLSLPELNGEEISFLAETAAAMKIPCVSVCALRDQEDLVREHLEALLAAARENGFCLLIKTTGIYADTARLRALLDSFACDELAALWDMHHPFRDFQEDPDTTIRNLGAYVRHVHLRDSDDDGAYNLIGEGTLPLKDMMRALSSIDYSGFISLEWKPEWMLDLPERDVIFPYFVNFMQRFESTRGKKKYLYPNHDGTGQYV